MRDLFNLALLFSAIRLATPLIYAALGGLFLPQQTKRARLFAAREELKQITAQSEREGSITSTERAMIHNVVDFQNVTARDVMKPLSQVATLKPNAPIPEVFEVSRASGSDRLPVVDAKGDTIWGRDQRAVAQLSTP